MPIGQDTGRPRPEWVAIVGSREYADLESVAAYVKALPAGTTVVSGDGGAVDKLAAKCALERGLTVIEIPALWRSYGKRAGFLRNEAIVRCADRVVAFWDGQSNGTRDTIQHANRYGKPCEVEMVL